MVLKVRMILLFMVMSLVGYSQMVVYDMPEQTTPPVSGYIAWYDSKDETSITKDGSNYVSQWNDKSGNGYNLVQNTGANQPLYSATNGIDFDGSNDWMNTSYGASYSQPITIFIVESINSNATSIIIDNYSTNTFSFTFRTTNFRSSAGTEVRWNYTYNSSFHIHNVIMNGTSTDMYEDGNLLSMTTGDDIGLNTMNGITLGNLYTKLSSSDISIKELIIYNSALTTDQITTVNTYLNLKYGGIY